MRLDSLPNKSEHPYSVSERNYEIRLLQPVENNRHAVFFTHDRETIDYHYERNPDDPRVTHAMTLEVDEFGNGLKAVAITYPRRTPADPEQAKTLITTPKIRLRTSQMINLAILTGIALVYQSRHAPTKLVV